MFGKETYINRRAALKKTLGSGLLLFIGNDEAGCNYAGNTYPYRQDSAFLYFFGQPYAGLSAVIDIDDDREIIFGDELTMDDIIWMGIQPTLREKCSSAGIGELMPSGAVADYLKKAQQKGRVIRYLPSYRPEHTLKLWNWLNIRPGEEQFSVDFVKAVVNMRNYKTEEEIAEIEKACLVTADMHLAAMCAILPGVHEYEVVAAITSVAGSNNCGLSFPVIATVNGQTLHNHYHGNAVKSGDLFLVDAGAETETGYAGDMSSTTPSDHRFTARQRDIYRIQTAMHDASVAALRPGVAFEEVYDVSAKIMIEGLKSLGLMHGDTENALITGAYALFYPHGLGHMMGLDVHDMENLGEVYVGYDGRPKSRQFGRASLRLARKLEPGFVHTVEPGIYFIPELIDQWKSAKKFADFINYDKVETYKDFGGIRNEEDYLITETGARLLGKRIPRTVEEVEAFRY
ncbi:MAG: aminopeptidase P family protein [Tannerella sp.]|jgi:Xaa-Pro aminopeptidase|nr:aminopeptidase P family protein [Tannerella sp.]